MTNIAVQGGAVAFDELEGEEGGGPSPVITADRYGRAATREGRVLWTDIDALLLECFPPAGSLPGQYPGVSYLFVDSVEITPAVPDKPTRSGNVLVWPYAVVKIGYKTPDYDTSTLLSRRYSFSADAMTLPSGFLRWGEQYGDIIQQEDVRPHKVIRVIEHSITHHRQASIPFGVLRTHVGRINDDEYEGAPAETLYFSGVEIGIEFDTVGNTTRDITYSFRERVINRSGAYGTGTIGWNHIWRPDTGDWDKPVDEMGNFLYQTADFTELFA